MAQITENYCSFETAKLLKEKGFDEKGVKVWYDESGEMYYDRREIKYQIKIENHEKFFQCPTLQMAMKWLREKHKLHCDVGYDFVLGWYNQITSLKEVVKDYDYEDMKIYHPHKADNYPSYEEACESAIKFCLENLI